MQKKSAGILLYRRYNQLFEFFLVHPGGPLYANKDAGWWTIPKGLHEENESPIDAAKREFFEETGFLLPDGELLALSSVVQKSGKVVSAFAIEGDCDPEKMVCNTCWIEWPPRSGKQIEIPECDRGGWFALDEAKVKINPAQISFLEEIIDILK